MSMLPSTLSVAVVACFCAVSTFQVDDAFEKGNIETGSRSQLQSNRAPQNLSLDGVSPPMYSPESFNSPPRMTSQLPDTNEVRLARIRTYKEGELTETQFVADQWNVRDPVNGLIGIVKYTRQGTTSEYTLGIYNQQVLDHLARQLPIREMLSNTLSNAWDFLEDRPNANFDAANNDALVLDVAASPCVLEFADGILRSVTWVQ